MIIENLYFFDKNGQPLNLDYNAELGYWKGKLYFPPLSLALFDNQHLFILEKINDNYYFPQCINDTLQIKWQDAVIKEFFLYDINLDLDLNLRFIEQKDSIEIDITNEFQDLKYPLEINIAFNPSGEIIYERTLEIYKNETKIAEIYFYGEGLNEDPRFTAWLVNFGIKFNKEDALILKDYDIKEVLPDWKNVNQIRKDLLVNKEEIFPYIGTYHGLINIINILGFKDVLHIKEYWKNVDKDSPYFDKFLMTDISDVLDAGKVETLNLIQFNKDVKFNRTFKKTGFLALAYEFVKETGDYDSDGLPIVEKTTEFSENEIFFKLNKLKNKLKEEYLPTNVVIKDIIGEYLYFNKYIIKVWTDATLIKEFNINEDVIINITPEDFLLVRDINPLYRKSGNNIFPIISYNDSNIDPYEKNQKYPVNEIPALVEAIEDYYDILKGENLQDIGNDIDWEHGDDYECKNGCPIILKLNIDELKIRDLAGITGNDFKIPTGESSPEDYIEYYTANNLKYKNIYEIEWIIQKKSPNPYYFKSNRERIISMNTLPHFLPYDGQYLITVRLYDIEGGMTIRYKKITVEKKIPQIIGIARLEDKFDYHGINLTNVKMGDFGDSRTLNPYINVINNENIDIKIKQKYLHWSFYKRYMYDVMIKNPTSGVFEDFETSTHPKKNYWGLNPIYSLKFQDFIGIKTKDLFFMRGLDCIPQDDFLAGFYFEDPHPGDIIRISGSDTSPHVGYTDYIIPDASPFTLETLIDVLNNSEHEAIKLFNYEIINDKIHAQSRQLTPLAFHLVEFVDMNLESPGISGDMYSFFIPPNIYTNDFLEKLESEYPSFYRDSIFLHAPIKDKLSGNVNNIQYWLDKNPIRIEDDKQDGFLLSLFYENYFLIGKIKIFHNTFIIPKNLMVYFILNNIVGKNEIEWTLFDIKNNKEIIKIKDVPFFVFKFKDLGEYKLSARVTDINKNEYFVMMNNFIKVYEKDKYVEFIEDKLEVRLSQINN